MRRFLILVAVLVVSTPVLMLALLVYLADDETEGRNAMDSTGAADGGHTMVGDARDTAGESREAAGPSDQTHARLRNYEQQVLADAPTEAGTQTSTSLVLSSDLQAPTLDINLRNVIDESLVGITGGCYRMGSQEDEVTSSEDEGPPRRVCIPSFAVGRHEVTNAQFRAFDADHSSGDSLDHDDQPVVNVTWQDAVGYTQWLSQKTGVQYRLLSESEWEFVARAGSTDSYWWGNYILAKSANCDGCNGGFDGIRSAPVASYKANKFGLHDTVGNVWEWVADCWHDSYAGAPTQADAWQEDGDGDCTHRVLRGGSYGSAPSAARSASRSLLKRDERNEFTGFRIARNAQ